MLTKKRLRIAVQKKGRLKAVTDNLFTHCGLQFSQTKNSLVVRCKNFPIDLLLVRDDDIPVMVIDQACDLGIVGENVLLEKKLARQAHNKSFAYQTLLACEFARCRLAIAMPALNAGSDIEWLQARTIATSYPNILQDYLAKNNLDAKVVDIAGSVELMPSLGMADAICDLVSTGKTLEENNLVEFATVLQSQAVVIRAQTQLSSSKEELIALLLRRFRGVIKAQSSKYIMFHAPLSSVDDITALLPGAETPTIMPFGDGSRKAVVHLVAAETVFWDTLEAIKNIGASSILVLPIEKMMS
jgi:ATP phosphoribosyltransferase